MRIRLITLLAIATLGVAGVAVSADPPAALESSAAPITQASLLARLERKDPDLVVLDVRTAAEFAAGHVPGARNVSHELLSSRTGELSNLRDKEVVLYCRSGRRSQLAADVLRNAGFTRLSHLEGDYLAWEAGDRPIEK